MPLNPGAEHAKMPPGASLTKVPPGAFLSFPISVCIVPGIANAHGLIGVREGPLASLTCPLIGWWSYCSGGLKGIARGTRTEKKWPHANKRW